MSDNICAAVIVKEAKNKRVTVREKGL